MKTTPSLTLIALLALAVSTRADTTSLDALEARLAALETRAPNTLNVQWRDGITFASDDKAFQLRLGGRVQNDWAFYLDADEALEDQVGQLEDGIEFRRIWLELGGTIYENTEYMVTLDFAGGRTGVRNMFLGFRNVPYLGGIRIGHQLEPFSLESITPNKYLTFIERGLPSAFYPFYNTGIRVSRTLADRRMTLSYGLFRETDDTGKIVSDSGYNATARLTGLPLASDDGRRLVHLGFSASRKGTPDGETTFRARPENRQAPFFAGVTNLPADKVLLAGLEFAAVLGSFSAQAEWYMASPDTEGNDPEFSGYYAQVSYFLTGEHRPYNRAGGSFDRVRPASNFRGKDGGCGAWEIAFRVSGIDFNDGDIDGGEVLNLTAAVNWYINPNLKIAVNYIHSDLKEVGEAHTLLTRFQFDF
ncbi:MAG TPA: porin [Kiritimatiellia bacterium]|nr:porin [Kiritimatiellia bacterium]